MASDGVARTLALDDSFEVVRRLAPRGAEEDVPGPGPLAKPVTELVRRDGEGPYVRKRIPRALANPDAWKAARRAASPLLPAIHCLYELPDQLVIVSDYIPGEPIQEAVDQAGPFDAARAAAIACDVCEAAGALHACGVVHRDITASNVILGEDGRAHLIDLGIARLTTQGARHDTTRLGTWGYAAPEQYGFAQTDARSDIYALGGLLGFMLSGARPGTDAFDEALAGLPKEGAGLSEVVSRARSFEPDRRYQTADEMREAITKAAPLQLAGPAFAGGVSGDQDGRPMKPVRHLASALKPFVPSARKIVEAWKQASAPALIATCTPAAWTVLLALALAMSPSITEARGGELFLNGLLCCDLFIFWGLIPWLEAACAILRLGPYQAAGSRRRLAVCLCRIAILAVAGFLALFAISFIFEMGAIALVGHAV